MVQNVNSQSQFGTINRVGNTPDGRVVYQVVNPNGQIAGGLSVAQKDCDTFERSYNTMMNAAPKLEKYMQTHTEDDIKRLQKKGKWIIGGSGLVGALIPAIATYKMKTWQQILISLGGAIIGLIGGIKIGSKVMTPPGAAELNKATQEISKLDIQPIV
jgi:hypothetical protein